MSCPKCGSDNTEASFFTSQWYCKNCGYVAQTKDWFTANDEMKK